jgi:glutamyl-tRNA reductase
LAYDDPIGTEQEMELGSLMQNTQLVCLGISHHTAAVEVREYFSNIHVTTRRDPAICELAVLSTCNRMEVYAFLDAAVADGYDLLLNFLGQVHHHPPTRALPNTYYLQGEAVVVHLCRVAAGLESAVIGEPQILGQVQNALTAAQEAQTIGPALSLLFRTAIQAGKRARTETQISTNPASTSSVAIALAQQAVGELRQQSVLVVGLGEIGLLTVTLLRSHRLQQLGVVNRTRAKAETVAAAWEGRATAYDLSELHTALQAADVVFTAASTPAPLIDALLLEQVMRLRQGRPLVLVDLAVPRNVAADVITVTGVRLYTVDDLRATLDQAFAARQREIPRVEQIIAAEVERWQQHFPTLAVTPLVADLRQQAEAIRQRELTRALKALGNVDAQTLAQFQHFSQALVNQLLHTPTVRLKQKASSGDVTEYAGVVRELFGLEIGN